jgi:hypothetical protein
MGERRKSRNADGIKMKAIIAVLVCFSVLKIFAGAPDSIQTEAILDERADRMELEIKLEVPVLTGDRLYRRPFLRLALRHMQ